MSCVNSNKICFIICSNNEQFLNECLLYLNLLNVPEGMETELLVIKDAKSMTSGYNEGMNASDAKYKVYMHQDTFITEKDFIKKLIDVFKSDEKIGMVGMIGAEKLSRDGVMWHDDRVGDFYNLDYLIENGLKGIDKLETGIREVEAVDGLLIATQVDIPWREDILKGWDFYDVSQCMEFRRAGLKVVVPAQNPSWTNHRCGAPAYWNYDKNRRVLLNNYPEILDHGKKQILFVSGKNINIIGPAIGLTLAGFNVRIHKLDATLGDKNDKIVDEMEEILEECHCELVFTYDFSIPVAVACKNMRVKYFSWVYDSPLFELYSHEAKYDTNFIRVFDKNQFERMKEQGLKHLYYGPLATDIEVFGAVSISDEDLEKYKADVSFVGRLYNRGRFDDLFGDDEEGRKYHKEVEDIFASIFCRWDGRTTIYGQASDELVDYMFSREPVNNWSDYTMDRKFYEESFKLTRRLNELERIEVLNHVAEKYNLVQYTDDEKTDKLKNVELRPVLLYMEEMPKAFFASKINLNISSRSIDSGLPQRIFDIMAVGGFVLTNYQPELEDYFEIGKDLEVFHNLKELDEKIAFYLSHENARVRIALNGYKKVRKLYSYTKLAKEIVEVVMDEEITGEDDCESGIEQPQMLKDSKSFFDMDADEKKKESDIFFRNLQEKYEKFETEGREIYSKIDELFRAKKSFQDFTNLMTNENVNRICLVEESFVKLRLLYRIAEKENAANIPTILQKIESIDDGVSLINQVNFYLRRIEFNWESDTYASFGDLIINRGLSYIFLAELICKTIYQRPEYICNEIENILKQRGEKLEAMKLGLLCKAYLEQEVTANEK